MRKVTAAQIATMTASVTASLGMVAATTMRYGIPMVGLAALAHADVYSDDELDDWSFTDWVDWSWVVQTYQRPSTGSTTTVPTTPPVATAPTDATGPIQRNAVECAEHYSVNVSVTFSHMGKGLPVGFGTKFVHGYAWGANTLSDSPAYIVTQTSTPPDIHHTGPLMGKTSFADHKVYIFIDEVQRYAANPNNHVTFDENLVNTIVHEWSHSWWSPREESEAVAIGNAAAGMYRSDGGSQADCNKHPPHNGSFGGHK